MANQGKRMIKENLIAQIGEASGVTDVEVNGTSVVEDGVASITITEYAAGDGIDFTTESDGTVVISADKTFEDYIITDNYNELTQEEAEALVAKIDNLRIVFNYDDNYLYFLLGKIYDGENYQEYEFYCDLNHSVINPYNPATVSVTKVVLHVQTDNYSLSVENYTNTIVSGTSDGTNWTELTIGNDTYGLASGGGSSERVIDFTKCALDYENEPGVTTYDDATALWMKDMPIFLGKGSGVKSALEAAGFNNIIEMASNTQFKIRGYFGFAVESTASSPTFQNAIYIYATKNTGSGNIYSYSTFTENDYVRGRKASGNEYTFTGTRFRDEKAASSAGGGTMHDLWNNAITIQQLQAVPTTGYVTVKPTSDLTLGREMEGGVINVKNAVAANANYGNQLTAPTSDGTYTLKVTVTSGVPTFNWELDQA